MFGLTSRIGLDLQKPSNLKMKRSKVILMLYLSLAILSMLQISIAAEIKSCTTIREEKVLHLEDAIITEAPYGEEWCLKQRQVRTLGERNCTSAEMILADSPAEEGPFKYFLMLFLAIGWGALLRTMLKTFGIPIPYTVLLMLSGLAFGFLSKNYCETLSGYTEITRSPPKIILYTFLPILIFESAFSIPVHTFMRCLTQILVTAFPGMLISTFATAGIALLFLRDYEWDLKTAGLFGAIISATDPVAVVAILRDLGTSEVLSVNIEGESLLNDGVAILLYEVFENIMLCNIDVEELGVGGVILQISLQFVQITLGGPIFGWLMAKGTIFWLSRIFNDAVVEVTLTLSSAYLTYFLGERLLGVSGVISVLTLGLTLSSERTSISPEVESILHNFWEMLGYLANTVLFVFVGIIIAESAFNSADWTDLYYLGFLYVALNLVRFLMLFVLYPILARIGYGLRWENMMVMTWGGLRGAVGLCLTLEVYSGDLCISYNNIGPKFLVQTAGIVILTLCVNGTTTEALLALLKLSDVSSDRIQDMQNALKQLQKSRFLCIGMLKHDRFVADANWRVVDLYTTVGDPYSQRNVKKTETTIPSILSLQDDATVDNLTECQTCHSMVKNAPTVKELVEITEESRLRVIRGLKVSFWHQFEHGTLSEVAVQLLVGVAESKADLKYTMVHAKDLRMFWQVHGVLKLMRKIFVRKTTTVVVDDTPPPTLKCLRRFWKLVNKTWFNGVILVINLFNMIPVIMELYQNSSEAIFIANQDAFFYVNIFFTMIYVIELVVKLLGYRHYYFLSVWNYIDLSVLMISIAEIGIRIVEARDGNNATIRTVFTGLRLSRILRVIRIPRYLFPAIGQYVAGLVNAHLFLGFDIGSGFITAVTDVQKILPQIVPHPRVLEKIHASLERARLDTVREMGLLQKDHPGIVIAVKTRHASRAILNQMQQALTELKADGLVDDKEFELLNNSIEQNMKRLWTSPTSIPPSDPVVLLANVPWVTGDRAVFKYVKEHAVRRSFGYDEVICGVGDMPDGIYIVISGLVKIHFRPQYKLEQEQRQFGMLPNIEIFSDMTLESEVTDFLTTSSVIGELGVLTGSPRSYTATCETAVAAYFISLDAMKHALETFVDQHSSLEARMWRSVGMRIGKQILPTQPLHQALHLDQIRNHLGRSTVFLGTQLFDHKFPNFIADVILLQGKVRNFHGDEIFTAPCLLPTSCVQIEKIENVVPPVVMFVAQDEFESIAITDLTSSQVSLYQRIVVETIKTTGHVRAPSASVPVLLTLNQQRDRRKSQAQGLFTKRK